MTRTKPKKYNLTRKNNKVKVLNPGSKPGKWKDNIIVRAYLLTLKGLRDEDLAIAFDVDINTIHYWKRTKPDFREAQDRGKKEFDACVEVALYRKALGYSHPDVHISKHKFTGEVIITPITKYYPPDTAACKFWLRNRQRERWADIRRVEGAIDHRHILDLTTLSDKELDTLDTIQSKLGIKELPEHGIND